ncbi:MAG TPA: hypothetical protein VH061_06640 [Solirubrobacteraceae bacterium]|jgi:hypothetical protein|nr:hypothetical protein [Solirubrobacteraceae bacterium]
MSTTQIPDVTVLAAIDRAERHRGRQGVPVWLIFEHLGIPRRSRRVRAQLQALVQDGAIEQRRTHVVDVWALAPAGCSRLQGVGQVDLPESPQHREWRNARTLAAQEIERFRGSLHDVLDAAMTQLDGTPHSDAWFELADGLRDAAWRLGSATYCLHEWVEPGDDRRTSTITSARPIWRSTPRTVGVGKLAASVDVTLAPGRTRTLTQLTRRLDRRQHSPRGRRRKIRWPVSGVEGH